MPETTDTSVHAIVSGRVQGVGFRFFVLREARGLGLSGSVRNLPDGRVEVCAAGPPQNLKRLEDLLRQGPWLSRVDQVELEWDIPMTSFSDFTIES